MRSFPSVRPPLVRGSKVEHDVYGISVVRQVQHVPENMEHEPCEAARLHLLLVGLTPVFMVRKMKRPKGRFRRRTACAGSGESHVSSSGIGALHSQVEPVGGLDHENVLRGCVQQPSGIAAEIEDAERLPPLPQHH